MSRRPKRKPQNLAENENRLVSFRVIVALSELHDLVWSFAHPSAIVYNDYRWKITPLFGRWVKHEWPLTNPLMYYSCSLGILCTRFVLQSRNHHSKASFWELWTWCGMKTLTSFLMQLLREMGLRMSPRLMLLRKIRNVRYSIRYSIWNLSAVFLLLFYTFFIVLRPKRGLAKTFVPECDVEQYVANVSFDIA